MNSIHKCFGLKVEELAEISRLTDLVQHRDSLHMKVNWSMLEQRPPGELNDFLYYAGEELAGFLGVYIFTGLEAEISGMVHPDYRRRGIFSALFQEAAAECKRRGVKRILLISERSSQTGKLTAAKLGASYLCSEYAMEAPGNADPDSGANTNMIVPANQGHEEKIAALDSACFGGSLEENLKGFRERMADGGRSVYVVLEGEKVAGKAGVLWSERYIFGVAVQPEFRGRGYGRSLLTHAVQELQKAGPGSINLEVSCSNERALTLYTSCGFRATTVYDYYMLPL